MSAPNTEPVTQAASDLEAGAAPVARPAAARDDLAVIGALLPYLRPYLGRILLALGLNILLGFAGMLDGARARETTVHAGGGS